MLLKPWIKIQYFNNPNTKMIMSFLFYANTTFSKFMKVNISSSLFKKSISSSHLTQTIILSLQFLKEKHVWKQLWLSQNSRSIFFFHFRKCYESIGSANALLGFHVFRGCDVIGHFLGKSKALWWKTFKSSSQEELRALADLGEYDTLPGASVLEGNI